MDSDVVTADDKQAQSEAIQEAVEAPKPSLKIDNFTKSTSKGNQRYCNINEMLEKGLKDTKEDEIIQ